MAAGTKSDLAGRLDDLRRRHGDSIRVEEIGAVVEALIGPLREDVEASDRRMLEALEALAEYIAGAKAEIAALRPDDVTSKYIPSAATELDAIVDATARATNDIMDATEVVEAVAGEVDDAAAERMMTAATKIYEACTFQDVTGQRVAKVVKLLRDIEAKVEALKAAFGSEVERHRAETRESEPHDGSPSDEDLLEGPQLPSDANKQADIDALFDSLE
jgi:chemotaxis protein CheZ